MRNAVLDAALSKRIARRLAIVTFVRMNFGGTAREWDRVNRREEHFAVGGVGRCG